MIKLNDLFWTFQGEGANWGRRALFVRMPFCNLKCSWCDTEFNTYKDWTEGQFIAFAKLEPSRFVVITGGEPMMNKHTPMVAKILKNLGFEVACETNGTFPIIDEIDFATVSPKRDADYQINVQAIKKCSELKLVVDEGFDFKVAKGFEKMFEGTKTRLTLSPEFGEMKKSVLRIEQFIQENPGWRLSLQSHKWIGIK